MELVRYNLPQAPLSRPLPKTAAGHTPATVAVVDTSGAYMHTKHKAPHLPGLTIATSLGWSQPAAAWHLSSMWCLHLSAWASQPPSRPAKKLPLINTIAGMLFRIFVRGHRARSLKTMFDSVRKCREVRRRTDLGNQWCSLIRHNHPRSLQVPSRTDAGITESELNCLQQLLGR